MTTTTLGSCVGHTRKKVCFMKQKDLVPSTFWFLAFAILVTLPACEPVTRSAGEQDHTLAGDWRAVLGSPGGELPFTLRLHDDEGQWVATALTATEAVPFSGVEQDGDRVVLRFAWYDSEITAQLNATGELLSGTWRRTSPGGKDSRLPFTAGRGDQRRFLPISETEIAKGDADAVPTVSGRWATVFRDEDDEEPAQGELTQDGTRVTGTFLTPTGDYRFLEGSYEDGVLRLSTFDGAHAFLFQAHARADGTLAGDFWSRDSYHATWTAEPLPAEESLLPDAWALAGLTNDDGRFQFAFPDLEGRTVSLADEHFAGKVVLVNIFGSWCPNCNDEAPLLAEWHRRYRDQGLEIVGLAYEFTGNAERDREMVRRFGVRYGIDYPLLLAGTNDKAAAAATLPDLTTVIAYPTTVFIGRDGKVRKIHSGFSGPGTGQHYKDLVTELEALIAQLLAESHAISS